MGVLTHEFSSSVAPERLFKALVLDGDNLIPQLAPNAVKSVEILEGDGGVGTTKKVTYFKGSAVQKTEAIDKDKLEIVYSVIEGDVLTDKIEKITYENKFVAAPGGGTVIKNVTTYHNRPGNSGVAHDQDQVEESKATGSQIFQLLEKYLLENPRAYN